MHEIHLRGRLANFLWKQQTTKAAGSGWRYNSEQGGGKLFSVLGKSLVRVRSAGSTDMGQVDGEGRGGGGRGMRRMVVLMAGMCLGWNSCDGDPSPSVEERLMGCDYSAWRLICISFGTPWPLRTLSACRSERQTLSNTLNINTLTLFHSFSLTSTLLQNIPHLSFHSKWHQGEVRIEKQMTNSAPYSLSGKYSSPFLWHIWYTAIAN